jgi:hypothetical protein
MHKRVLPTCWPALLVYTPTDPDHVRGVQGRYFLSHSRWRAVFIAALVNCDLPRGHARSDCDRRLTRRYCDRIGEMSGRHCQLSDAADCQAA